jgi:thiosulfate/3-mercaptopyruvate sulfurtransferase
MGAFPSGRQTDCQWTGPPQPRQPRHFTARFSGSSVRDKADVVRAIESGSSQLADARSPGRFKAEEPEPREGMRGGHMPGAVERALPHAAE